MPAHKTAANFDVAVDSDGRPVTALMWQAIRLADALAKSAAGSERLPPCLLQAVKLAAGVVRHFAAVLGSVTYAANHHPIVVEGEDGVVRTVLLRDSTACPRRRASAPVGSDSVWCLRAGGGPGSLGPGAVEAVPCRRGAMRQPGVVCRIGKFVAARGCPASVVHGKLQRRARLAQLRSCSSRQAAALAAWVAERPSLVGGGCAAVDRLVAVRARVLARLAGL